MLMLPGAKPMLAIQRVQDWMQVGLLSLCSTVDFILLVSVLLIIILEA
jgi:hypothetical protein